MNPSNNRKRLWKYLLPAAVLILIGWYFLWPKMPREVDRALIAATEIELYSLDPKYFENERTETEFENIATFRTKHGNWKVLGKTKISDPATISELANAFRTGIKDRSAMARECFWPRHAIRVVHEGAIHDLVICFECNLYKWYKGDEPQRDGEKLISEAPQPIFNRILKEAGVTLAEPAFE